MQGKINQFWSFVILMKHNEHLLDLVWEFYDSKLIVRNEQNELIFFFN